MVQAGDGDGLERLARYLARPPVSLERMEWDREKGEVLYRTARGHAEERGGEEDGSDDLERIDELEFLARVVTQLPRAAKAFDPVLRLLRDGGEGQTAAGKSRG